MFLGDPNDYRVFMDPKAVVRFVTVIAVVEFKDTFVFAFFDFITCIIYILFSFSFFVAENKPVSKLLFVSVSL